MILRFLLLLTLIAQSQCQTIESPVDSSFQPTTTVVATTLPPEVESPESPEEPVTIPALTTKKVYPTLGWSDDNYEVSYPPEDPYDYKYQNKYNDGYGGYGRDNDKYDSKKYGNDKYDSKKYGDNKYDSKKYGDDKYDSKKYGDDKYDSKKYGDDKYDSKKYGDDKYDSKKYDDDEYNEDSYRPSGYRSERKKRVPDSYDNMNLYIREPSKGSKYKKLKRMRFPVNHFRKGNFPPLPPLISLTPWLPIFHDKFTKQTIIFSPTGGLYIIPPVISFYGKLFSVAQLIAWGYCSLVSTGAPIPPSINVAPLVRPGGVVGPGVPPPNVATGGFAGGVKTNFSNFKSTQNTKVNTYQAPPPNPKPYNNNNYQAPPPKPKGYGY